MLMLVLMRSMTMYLKVVISVSGGVEYVAVALMNFTLICTGNLGTDDRKYIGLHGRSVVLGILQDCIHMVWILDQSLYNFGIAAYENHGCY